MQPEISIALSEDFLQAVAERTAEIIESRSSRWLYGDKAAADYLGWPVGRVTKLRQSRELPAHARGQRFSFHTAELDAYVRGVQAEDLPSAGSGPMIGGPDKCPGSAETLRGSATGGKS